MLDTRFPQADAENDFPRARRCQFLAALKGLSTPLRQFLRAETGSAAVLLGATVAALGWANISASSYHAVWATRLSVSLGGASLSQDLGEWVNSGLMTLFFLVVGLEARREFDMGELRQRRRLALPVLAGLGGMLLPAGIYLAVNAGQPSAHGWGASMSTDTAFALSALALVGRRLPDRVRTYLLTFAVVDDLAGIAVIAFAYSGTFRAAPFLAGAAILVVAAVMRFRGLRSGPVYLLLGVAAWVAFFSSGVDPVVVGLVLGLLSYARPAARTDLEQATDAFRLFREQPTPELARSAREGVRVALSPNDRLQQLYHQWASYLIVPLFALSNAGVVISSSFLARAFTSPVTLGILAGYMLGKPAGTVGAAWLVSKASRGRISPPVGWVAVTGAGTIAGIGFTVSLLIALLAFRGPELAEAKVGVLSAGVCAALLTWTCFRATDLLPKRARLRALLGTSEVIIDLAVPVDPHHDHLRGPEKAPVTVVEYGDFECPHCGQAEPVLRELLADPGDVRYVWRHLPLTDVHPRAQRAAEAAEAAGRQGAFWEMHDLLFERQDALSPRDLIRYAAELGLDAEKFGADLRNHVGAARVAQDLESADLSGVSGIPTFFINGSRHHGAYDIISLKAAVKAARAQAAAAARPGLVLAGVPRDRLRQPQPAVAGAHAHRRRPAEGCLAEAGDVSRFGSARKLASRAGLTPTVRGSDRVAHYGHISKQGSAWLRWVLCEAAQTARRSPEFAAGYQAIARRRGKKIATTAVARKLATRAWHLLTDARAATSPQATATAAAPPARTR